MLKKSQLDFIDFARDNKIYWADAAKYIPEEDDSLEVVYTSHMIEHLDRDEAFKFLNEAFRTLKKGGIIRIVVPDLYKQVKEYLQHKDADAFIEKTLLTRPKPKSLLSKLKFLFLGERNHQFMYDENSLIKLISSAGFADVESMLPGKTKIQNPGDLDLSEQKEISIYVEGVKI